ncbi:DNA adenine methylase [Salmonella enterica]|uniref:site-specific DNA-methyltransferase (adenine-specific) n=1 Tax=Salmonella enterica TaxID=28901 RepID=A0A5U0NXA7_SALER|nr:DNA adenine methylase [Salmonella enterica]EAA7727677.1 DNA adenine methylase [Salmonella enterica subsp. enterica serovar Pomona]EAC2152210.1 DNA adenine methylase [Salmonella enterica subsp. enterica]EAM4338191.1 DNA adenine methylase [Salmonella enterica subsp. enterica serovar Minnesota]EAN3245724.1 DNA adenine methylase [Salmonella enterica subsp. enterica serovar Give]ECS8314755.1 DNA adenine methylase [Salmonella enterica subsp. enterica serovar Panama]ECT7810837.1 DNA adenine methy
MRTYEFEYIKNIKKQLVTKIPGSSTIPSGISPFRYPGGKAKLSSFIALFVVTNKLEGCTLVEPFCGGAGGTLPLLHAGLIDRLVLNDLNPGVYSFWLSLTKNTNALINMIENEPVTIDAWQHWREVYYSEDPKKHTTLEKGFATFFLNRTNRSGMLHAGPIGGQKQSNSDYKLDCRFTKKTLIQRIERLAVLSNKISVSQKDACNSIHNISSDSFIYADPPYVKEGRNIYSDFCFSDEDHRRFSSKLKRSKAHWLLSYDDHPLIHELYEKAGINIIELSYAINKAKIGRELLIASTNSRQPSFNLIDTETVTIIDNILIAN